MDAGEERALRILAAMDQLAAALGETARIVGGYFTALLEQDFTRAEALELTRDFQGLWIQDFLDASDAAGDAVGDEEPPDSD